VDEVMHYLQGSIEKAEIKRFRALSVRMGVAGPYGSKAKLRLRKQRRRIIEKKAGRTVAKVIEFYIPNNFRKNPKSVSREQRGKVIEFAPAVKKSA